MTGFNLQPIRDKLMEDLKGLEKTCENCEYELEDTEGTHCRHCIHNAEENFKPKEIKLTEQEIRNKAIDEFLHKLFEASYEDYDNGHLIVDYAEAIDIAEQMKAVRNE